LINVFEVLLKN